jgi:hypothetical protein
MLHYYCDCCGAEINHPSERYVVKIKMYAAPELPDFTEEDFMRDHQAEMERLVKEMEERDAAELSDEVYVEYEFDLCIPCRKIYYQRFQGFRPLKLEPGEPY